MELKELLAWVISGGGAGVFAYFLIERIAALKALAPEPKRYVAIALSGVLAVGAWFIAAAMGYAAWPVGANAWIEQLFSVATYAFALSQIIHGAAKLPASEAEAVAMCESELVERGYSVELPK
jgi:ABC-type dipeptide/oligopeptide/nickel transport system permease subunit